MQRVVCCRYLALEQADETLDVRDHFAEFRCRGVLMLLCHLVQPLEMVLENPEVSVELSECML